MIDNLKNHLENLEKKFFLLGGIFDTEEIQKNIHKLEQITHQENFWQIPEKSNQILSQIKKLKKKIEPWQKIKEEIEELNLLYMMNLEEKDECLEEDISRSFLSLEDKFESLILKSYLSDELDSCDAFLTIQSGAGGTEACDWAQMLMRMYLRWSEREGLKAEIADIMEAEGGIKSVTIEIKGDNAYGYLKCETGIHRLVRISPFDSSSRRHTSFCSIYADPILSGDIEVNIKSDEIRIDTYRAQGAGGQHVNKTDSAVRITHLPTGIVTQCQNERSQHKNKETAMKMLKTRLYEHYQSQKDAELAKKIQEKKEISWGNQIRSYFFHPYNLIKDHRTKYEVGNTQAVMDGEINGFIESCLKWSWQERNS